MGIVLLLVLILAAILGIIRALLRGTLTLHRAGVPTGTVKLPELPFVIRSTDDLIGVSGRMFVMGIPFTRRMHVWIRCPGRPGGDGTLRPGGKRYVSGVWVAHDHEAQVPQEEPQYSVDHESWELSESVPAGEARHSPDGGPEEGSFTPDSGNAW